MGNVVRHFPLDPLVRGLFRLHLIKGFLQLWKEKYTTAENYLHSIGLTDLEIEHIRRKLC